MPFYTRDEESAHAYISRIEKLIPITEEEFNNLNNYDYIVNMYVLYKTRPDVVDNHFSGQIQMGIPAFWDYEISNIKLRRFQIDILRYWLVNMSSIR